MDKFLVLQDHGVQISSTNGHFPFLTSSTRFISKSDVHDILINEAFIGYQICFVLIVLEANSDQFQVVFQHLRPRRDVVEMVWRLSRECFFGTEYETIEK